jgi:hypothetical protein
MISLMHRPLPYYSQHSQKTSMPPAGFEPAIPASEMEKYTLDCAAIAICNYAFTDI